MIRKFLVISLAIVFPSTFRRLVRSRKRAVRNAATARGKLVAIAGAAMMDPQLTTI